MTNIVQKFRPWDVQVQEFGLTKQVIAFLNMEGSEDNHHVSYPCQFPPRIDYDESKQVVYPETWRSRVLPDALTANSNQARFFQNEGENLPMFYTPNYEALRQAVSISNGELNMYEGDKDTWTAIAAGYFNSVGLFSAGSAMTEELGYQLKAIGVKTIRYYPDADHAGWHLAERLLAIMAKSDIRVNVFHLPLYIRGHRIKDTSDVWLALDQNPELYNQILRGLRQLVLPSQVNLERAKDGEGIFNSDFYNQIEIALGITKYKNGGWSDYTKCIFHDHEEDDTDPKFGWNKTMHIARCFKCGETWLAKDVAEKLGIDWKKYVNSGRDKDKIPSISSPSTSLESPAKQLEQAKASELKIANNLFGGINAESNFSDVPSSEFMYTLDEALDNYALRLVGALPTAYPPLPNPIKPMHKLGGNARIITRPTMIGILGISGGFKCVVEDTRVQTEHGLVRIDHYATGKEGFSDLNVGMWSPDGLKNASHIVDSGIAPTKKITTRFGYDVQGTYEHPLMVLDTDGQLKWRKLHEIKAGDFLAIQRKEGVFGNETLLPDAIDYSLKVTQMPARVMVRNGKQIAVKAGIKYGGTVAKIIDTPECLDVETAYVFGLLTGDGGLTGTTSVNYTTADPELLHYLQTWLTRMGLKAKYRGKYNYNINSVALRDWLAILNMCHYSYDKVVPEVVFTAPKEQIKAFLQGLFDTDGSAAWKDKYKVQLATSSPQLAKEVHQLLLMFGIVARRYFVANKHKGDWRVEMKGQEAQKFFDRVGFRLQRKQAISEHKPARFNTNIDLVPYLPEVDVTKLAGNRGSRGRLRALLQNTRRGNHKMSYSLLQEYKDVYPEFKDIADKYYFFDEVTAVEDSGDAHCYDVHIPDGHTFIAGGFVSHNTSILQWVSNKYSQDGYHGIIYSPEWSPERNADRIIQQMGGMKMSQMSLLSRYYYEQSMIEKGILASDDTSVFGEKPDDTTLLKSESAISYVRNAFRGKIVYLKDFGSSILDILAMTKEAYKRMADDGYTPSYFIFDYAQMAEPPMNWPGRWDMQMTIKQTKKLTMELGLITWMASQVRKSDTEDLAGSDGDILTSTSGLNFHDHQFNLFLTVNPMKEVIVFPNGRRLREVKLAVTKNSEGDKADTKDLAISMFVDLDRMLMLEYANENAPALFAISSNDPDLKEALEDINNTRPIQIQVADTGIDYESAED